MLAKTMYLYFTYLILFHIVCNSSICNAQTTSLSARIDKYVHSLEEPFTGTILLAIEDSILFNKGYGQANIAYGIPNTANTKYLIGSTTKPFTSILVLKLAEQGLIDLNATIDTYLPDYPNEYASKVTVHHLLLHQSGIPHHYVAIDKYFGNVDQVDHTREEYIALFAHVPLLHEPGAQTTYTSLGYYLLGVILEVVSNKSYAELVDEYIFKPLEMRNSHVENNLTVFDSVATGYKKGLSGYTRTNSERGSNTLGAGDIISTTEDLYHFQRILNRGGDDILSEEYKRLLFQPPDSPDNVVYTYAGPIERRPYNNGIDTLTTYGLGTGSSYGFQSRMTNFMEKNAYYVVLSNIQFDNTMSMSDDMYDFLANILMEKLGLAQEVDPDTTSTNKQQVMSDNFHLDKGTMDRYAGYYSRDDKVYSIYGEGDKYYRLMLYNKWGFDFAETKEVVPVNDSEFVFLSDDLQQLHYRFTSSGDDKPALSLFWENEFYATTAHIVPSSEVDLNEIAGLYYSPELQKTYKFTSKESLLYATEFLNEDNVVMTPLRKDFFGCKSGFLFIQRNEDNSICGFKLVAPNLGLFGSDFLRK